MLFGLYLQLTTIWTWYKLFLVFCRLGSWQGLPSELLSYLTSCLQGMILILILMYPFGGFWFVCWQIMVWYCDDWGDCWLTGQSRVLRWTRRGVWGLQLYQTSIGGYGYTWWQRLAAPYQELGSTISSDSRTSPCARSPRVAPSSKASPLPMGLKT